AIPAPHVNAPTHSLEQLPHDAEAESRSTELAGTRLVDLAEVVPDGLQVVRPDPYAGIANHEAHRLRPTGHDQAHRALLGELHRVGEQVEQDLLQAYAIRADAGAGVVHFVKEL